MNKYNEMSDFEINLKVADKLGIDYTTDSIGNLIIYKHSSPSHFNPCNNPSDAMPIINKYGISLVYQDGKFQFATHDGNIECCDNNPLRASMIILLCMLDGDYEP